MQLEVVSAVDANRVDLRSSRNASFGRILDNDRKWINILQNVLQVY